MGQKVNPNGLRYGTYKKWNSIWHANKHEYPNLIISDHIIRKSILAKYEKKLQITLIKIIRKENVIQVELHTSKASIILGENEKIYKHLKKFIEKLVTKNKSDKKIKVELKITSIKNIYLDAQWVANDIATKIENRGNYKLLQKFAISNAMKSGAVGIKTKISGRLNGVDIARSEGYSKGRIPLNTLRSKIHYAFAKAVTTYGVIGVAIWICLGEDYNYKHKKQHIQNSSRKGN